MSYKSLLFCPDEKAARVVTQVLTELEFAVELSNEPFVTVKKLTDEHFDALVVDCQNEQDAALLFRGARNSSLNHSSLSVAVVEGQAGVAKAFRIGANLVLTKPINIEQSKSTLRVARGLLRKNEPKPAISPAASIARAPGTPAMMPAKAFALEPATLSAVGPAAVKPAIPPAPAASAPFAALELEQDPTPAPEPSEVALLESMPDPIDGKPAAEPMWAPKAQGQAEPIAASTGGQAAAVAPALDKPAELKLAGASPLVTNEPIVKGTSAPEHFPVTSVPVPTFSSLDRHASSPHGGKKFIKTVAMLLIFGAAGYVAWQKLQPLQYVHRSAPAPSVTQPAGTPAPSPAAAPAAQPPAAPENIYLEPTPAATAPEQSAAAGPSTASAAPSTSARNFSPETIRVQELPMTSDQKNSSAPRPQVIVVKTKPGNPVAAKPPQQPAPPSLPLSTANNSNAALANIVSTDAPAPKPAPGSFRVSQGVSQGLVVKKVAPIYSATALQLRKQGAVELMATISKDGAVTRVQVLSGDLILANSAVEAVRQWKYRPYLLNGEPVEIETQITVNFRLPH